MSVKIKLRRDGRYLLPFLWIFSLIGFVSMQYWKLSFVHSSPSMIELASSVPYDLSELKIYGEDEYCQPHNKYKYIDISGLYNTGTNALYNLLSSNCFGSSINMRNYFANDEIIKNKSNTFYILQKKEELNDFIEQHNIDNVRFTRAYWSPKIGKHHMIPSEKDFENDALFHVNDVHNFDYKQDGLHIVIIKDPLTWFKSICKASYLINFADKKWQKKTKCPANISDISANIWHGQPFSSLISTWNEFYESWIDQKQTIGINMKLSAKRLQRLLEEQYGINATNVVKLFLQNATLMDIQRESNFYDQIPGKNISSLIVRFEDVLFNPQFLVKRLCNCVGGITRNYNEIIINDDKTKSHGRSRNRKEALNTYHRSDYRYSGYNAKDLLFMKSHLNHNILNMFGYSL